MIGSHLYDQVGYDGIGALTNGNYVVKSGYWDNGYISDAGAVTWGNGTTGVKGVVNSVNSLVGSTLNDAIGHFRSVTILNNGNYVVNSFNWDNGNIINAGAATWGNGNSGISGVISSANSIVGSKPNDSVGCGGTTALTNGNYVVSSFKWDNGSIYNAGAVTWGNGTNGTIGLVSIYNSLVGSNANDKISYNETGEGISALANGNYVVNSYLWDNGGATDAGAVTWGNGTSGIRGAVSTANSLIGSTAKDYVGLHGITALSNGNYVVQSDLFQNYTGAATWCNGLIGRIGAITSTNSLVGTTSNDRVGAHVTPLNNGNYVVVSYSWHNGNIESAGAVSWGDGNRGVNGVVSSANSLVGNKTSDFVGYGGVIALANGGYVVVSNHWNNGIILDAGAITKGDGNIGIKGVVGSSNSLIGSKLKDQVGGGSVTALYNGNYIVNSPIWDNGAISNAGAVTLGNGAGNTTGPITSCNSVTGNKPTNNTIFSNPSNAYNYIYEKLIVGKPLENIVTIFAPSQSVLAMVSTNTTTNLNGAATVAFVDNNCKLITAIKPAGALPLGGIVKAKVYVETDAFPGADGKAYVSRHFDISPSTSPDKATASVTLYYSQAELDNYNANNGNAPDLPASPTDESGKAQVNITQQHGTSATGMIDSYSGWNGNGPANVTINPGAANVIWNENLMRWEITFNVTGFSGFFLRGDKNYPLAVSLVNFTAKAESNRNRLDWNTDDETQGISFEVERSADGNSFGKIGQVTGKGKNAVYVFYDEEPINGNNYYRLKMVELSGEASYSNVVLVKRNDHSAAISVFPNPAENILNIKYSNNALVGSTVSALDLQGRTMATTILTTSTAINVQKWPAGIYMLRFVDGSVVKVVKK